MVQLPLNLLICDNILKFSRAGTLLTEVLSNSYTTHAMQQAIKWSQT